MKHNGETRERWFYVTPELWQSGVVLSYPQQDGGGSHHHHRIMITVGLRERRQAFE